MASVAFSYNGSNECVATITGATVGHTYELTCNFPAASYDAAVAVTSTLVLTVSDIGGLGSLAPCIEAYVQDSIAAANPYVGCTIFEYGTPTEFPFAAEWSYDGVDTVTVTFPSESQSGGDDTCLQVRRGTDAGGNSTDCVVGDGTQMMLSGGSTPTGFFYARLFTEPDGGNQYNPQSNRLFTAGVAGEGTAGNPSASDSVLTQSPSGVGTTSATFGADVNPDGASSTVAFEYGLTTAYGSTTASQSIGSGSSPVAVTQFVDGLRPGRTYHVRAVRTP